jgi:hypothetical protein
MGEEADGLPGLSYGEESWQRSRRRRPHPPAGIWTLATPANGDTGMVSDGLTTRHLVNRRQRLLQRPRDQSFMGPNGRKPRQRSARLRHPHGAQSSAEARAEAYGGGW